MTSCEHTMMELWTGMGTKFHGLVCVNCGQRWDNEHLPGQRNPTTGNVVISR